jgi:hypothetical protein
MKFLPKEFYNLKFLVYFNLSWNDNLEELPNSKGELQVLKWLHLRYFVNLAYIPYAVVGLKGFQYHNLYGCKAL